MNNNTRADAEIVLRPIEHPRWVVINLDCANIDTVVESNVQTAANCAGQTRVSLGEVRARRWKDRNATSAECGFVLCASYSNQGLSKWLESALVRVVFQLHTTQKIEQRRLDAHVRAAKRKIIFLKVASQIKLNPDIACDVAGNRSVEAMKAFALINDVAQVRIRVVDTSIYAVVGVAAVKFDLVVITCLREPNRGARNQQNCCKHKPTHDLISPVVMSYGDP